MPLDSATFAFKIPTFDLPPTGKAQTAKADKTSSTDGAEQATGSGSLSQTGAAPDPHGAKAAVVVSAMALALGSLEMLMPGGHDSSDDLEVELAAVIAKLKKTTDDVDKGKLKTDAEQKEAAIKQQKDALAKAEKKSEEAAHAAKHHVSLADKFKAAFAWIGAIVAVVVAVVLIATGVGAAVGVALLAAAAIAIAMAADQTVQLANQASGKHDGMGMFGMMFEGIGKSLGMSGDKLKAFTERATMGLNMALMVASIALSFADPEGAENAVTEAAEIGPNMAKLGMNATRMEKVVAKVQDIAEKAVGDLKGLLDDAATTLKSAKSAMSNMREEGLLKQLERGASKIESLSKELKAALRDGVDAVKGKGKELADELKSVKNTLSEMKQEGAAKQVERAYVEVKSLLEDLVGDVLLKGMGAFNKVKSELRGLDEEGAKSYALDKLKAAIEDFKGNFRAKDEFGEVTKEKKFSGFETAKYAREKGADLQDKGDAVTDAYSSVQRSNAQALTGESNTSKADAKAAEALEKLLSAAIDMVLMQMKKHGEAFDTQIDQIMDGMRSHQNSLTRHVA